MVEQLFGRRHQVLHLLLNRVAAQAQQIRDRRVLLVRDISLLVRRRQELGRYGRVIRNDVRQHERIGPAVRHSEVCPEGMRQRVIHAHRRVGKRHRRNAGGIVHHGARLFIARMLISDGQVLERHPDRLHGVAICIGRSVTGNGSFQRMGQAVDAGIGRKALRHGHNKLRIDDGHIRGQRVVGEGYFAPALFVGQHGKGSDFAPGSAGGGDGNQPRPVNFLGRVLDHALAQIEKWCGQFFQISSRRLVLEFHDLGRIDYRPAAQRDDLVRFVKIQRLHSLHDLLDLGLRIGND